jgi:two-component sensor histidine kinase
VRFLHLPESSRSATVSGLDAPQPSAGVLHVVESGNKSGLWLTLALIGAYAAAGLVILPFAGVRGPVIPGLSTFFAAGVFVTELSTGFLLFVRFRERRAASILLLACAYLYSGLMAIPYLLTFPDAILRDTSIVGTAHSTAWIFICWIFGFALLTLGAVVLEAWFRHLKILRPESATSTGVAAVVATVAVIAMISIMRPESLPVLIGAHGWTGLDDWLSCLNMAMLAASLTIIFLAIGDRNELFLWLALALTAMLFGNILSTAGGGRFTVGWSVSRLSWVFSGCALFLYFMGQFVRQQRLLHRSREALERAVTARTSDLIDMIGQRDLLLREVHHRVKNNFQVVNSLISYQAGHTESDETRAALQNLHSRVYALGLVHQRLMQSDNLSTFDVRAFLGDLCVNVATLAAAEARHIRIGAEADPLQTDLDFAGPLALLVTELVSAAFAHFGESQRGTIHVSLRRNSEMQLTLEVSDTAMREPDVFDSQNPESESRVLRALLTQLCAKMSRMRTENSKGTIVRVTMPFTEQQNGSTGTGKFS